MKWSRLTSVAGGLALMVAAVAPAFAEQVSQAPGYMCQTSSTESGSDPRRVQATLVIGDTVYFGGRFNQVLPPNGGAPVTRNYLAACSLTTGQILPWNPNPGGVVTSGGGIVYALVTDGTRIYAGGAFDTVAGLPVRGGLVALDSNPMNANPTPLVWGDPKGPGVTNSRSVKALALSPDNQTIYVGGTFPKASSPTSVATDRLGLAAFSTTDGSLKDWNPTIVTETQASCPPDDPTCVEELPQPEEVRALIARSDKIIAGGYFRLPSSVADEGHIAAFEPTTGAELPWEYKTDYAVIALASAGDRIYAAGAGQGVSKNTLTGLNASDGKKTWQVNADGNWQAVYAMNGIVYGGGHMLSCGPKNAVRNFSQTADAAIARTALCAFIDGIDMPLDWTPNPNVVGNGVFALTGSSSALIAGGAFTKVGDAKAQGLAKFSADFPSVTGIGPTAVGLNANNVPVSISGTKFAQGASVGFGEGITVLGIDYISPSQLVARISVDPNTPAGTRDVIVTNPSGEAGLCNGCLTISATPPTCPPVCGPVLAGGYWMVATDGGIFSYGDAKFFGSTGNIKLNQPIVGMAVTPSKKGYWLVASDGGIFAYGDAAFFGSTGNIKLNKPIVGMTSTPSGRGYWMVASDGGIFAFGDAAFKGSTGAIKLNQPIVGMTTTPAGQGYWLVASDGGIFAFGDASFKGSTGNIKLAKPITAMTSTRTGQGYWMTATDGGIFAFGDASFHGSTGGQALAKPIVAMSTSPTGQGYLLAGANGAIFAFGDAKKIGNDLSGTPLAKPIVGMTGF
jgi:hypothetical protein